MSDDVRIICSAALAGRAQPRGAVTNQRRRRSSAVAVWNAISIHVVLSGMVALCCSLLLSDSVRALQLRLPQDVASASTPARRFTLDRNAAVEPLRASAGAEPEVRVSSGLGVRGFCRVKRRVAAIFRIMCTSHSFCFPLFISNPAPPANSSRQTSGYSMMRRSAGAGMAAQQSTNTMENMTHH